MPISDNPALLGWLVAWAMGLLMVLLGALRKTDDAATVSRKEPRPPVSSRDRFQIGLARSRERLGQRLRGAFSTGIGDDRALETLEQALIESDVGVRTSQKLLEVVGALPGTERTESRVRAALRAAVRDLLQVAESPPEGSAVPWVTLVVGVNGVGKTTTIGKLAARHVDAGESVLLVAGDTFRAAAIDQLAIWAERTGAELIRQEPGSDPSAVVFDGISAAVARGTDRVFVDTAGRLHTEVNLMAELQKVRRVVERVCPGAPHEVLLVVDATTGQNALAQARSFREAVQVSGVILTKLDGSARGGMVASLCDELGLPVRYVGLGESAADLQPFDADAFVEELLPDTD